MRFTKDTKFRSEKCGSVIFDTLREKVFVSNETGARLLQLVDEGAAEQEIVHALCDEFDGDPDKIARDVKEFLLALAENDLVVKEEE